MKSQSIDIRIARFLAGELSENDQQALCQEAISNPALAAAMEEMSAAWALLHDAMSAEEAAAAEPKLSPERRAAILAAPLPELPPIIIGPWLIGIIASAAAMIAGAFCLIQSRGGGYLSMPKSAATGPYEVAQNWDFQGGDANGRDGGAPQAPDSDRDGLVTYGSVSNAIPLKAAPEPFDRTTVLERDERGGRAAQSGGRESGKFTEELGDVTDRLEAGASVTPARPAKPGGIRENKPTTVTLSGGTIDGTIVSSRQTESQTTWFAGKTEADVKGNKLQDGAKHGNRTAATESMIAGEKADQTWRDAAAAGPPVGAPSVADPFGRSTGTPAPTTPTPGAGVGSGSGSYFGAIVAGGPAAKAPLPTPVQPMSGPVPAPVITAPVATGNFSGPLPPAEDSTTSRSYFFRQDNGAIIAEKTKEEAKKGAALELGAQRERQITDLRADVSRRKDAEKAIAQSERAEQEQVSSHVDQLRRGTAAPIGQAAADRPRDGKDMLAKQLKNPSPSSDSLRPTGLLATELDNEKLAENTPAPSQAPRIISGKDEVTVAFDTDAVSDLQIVNGTVSLADANEGGLGVNYALNAQSALVATPEVDDAPLPPAPPEPAPPVNPFVMTADDALSTFALESESGSWNLARRYIRRGYLPPPAIIRMEEFVNYFDYNYPAEDERTFTVHPAMDSAPFGKDLALLKVGVRGKVLGRDGRKPAHLVFLVDASGSMGRPDRLPIVQEGIGLALGQLQPEDRVTLIAYGASSHLLCEARPAADAKAIRDTLLNIEPGTATNMAEAIRTAYDLAARYYRAGQVNRIILCSDGVANVGPADADDLLATVARYRRQGISFTSIGVGAGAYNDRLMEQLANQGDGQYIYLDSADEARRAFVDNFSATLNYIARNVKIQVAFDPTIVRRYRLIGYENRNIADQDFRNDKVDAGEIGSGQSATALYEVELTQPVLTQSIGTVNIRYMEVDTDEVHEFATAIAPSSYRARPADQDPRFQLAACAAEFAEILRHSDYAQNSLADLEQRLIPVANALPLDQKVQELLQLVRQSQNLPEYQ